MILGRRKSVDTPPRSLLHSLFPGLPLPHAAGRRRDLRRPICQPRSSFRLLEKSESLADDQVSLQPERDHVSYVHSNACRICCWFPRRRHVSCDCQICLRLLPPSLWFARHAYLGEQAQMMFARLLKTLLQLACLLCMVPSQFTQFTPR